MATATATASSTQEQQALDSLYQSITKQVNSTLGKAKLKGVFNIIEYAPGCFPFPNINGVMNGKLYNLIDQTVHGPTHGTYTMSNASFATLMNNLYANIGYQLSTADNKTVTTGEQNAAVYGSSLVSSYEAIYGPITPDAGSTKIDYVFAKIEGWGGFSKVSSWPPSAQTLAPTALGYKTALGPALAIKENQLIAQMRLAALQSNIVTATATNKGIQTTDTIPTGYVPAYDGMSPISDITNSLRNTSNEVSLGFTYEQSSATQATFSASGSVGLSVGIDFLSLGFGASSSYKSVNFSSHTGKVSFKVTYEGVTTVPSSPLRATASDLSTLPTGWYDADILNEVKTKTGKDITGYQFISSQYSVSNVFGPKGLLSRVENFVISQQPILTITFDTMDMKSFQSQFNYDSGFSVKLFGLFTIASGSAHYQKATFKQNATGQGFSITFTPDPSSVSVTAQDSTFPILGGVINYPPSV